jgi:hypothetical protein
LATYTVHQAQVTDLLTFPQHHCPDVLVLGLLQINPPITILRQATHTLCLMRIPTFLKKQKQKIGNQFLFA